MDESFVNRVKAHWAVRLAGKTGKEEFTYDVMGANKFILCKWWHFLFLCFSNSYLTTTFLQTCHYPSGVGCLRNNGWFARYNEARSFLACTLTVFSSRFHCGAGLSPNFLNVLYTWTCSCPVGRSLWKHLLERGTCARKSWRAKTSGRKVRSRLCGRVSTDRSTVT